MKYLIALFILMFIALIVISVILIIINKLQDWALEDSNKALAECNQKVIECNQLEVNRENLEAQIKFQEELEFIDILSGDELQSWEKEFYTIPTTEEVYEEVYLEPERKVCIREVLFKSGLTCIEYAVVVE